MGKKKQTKEKINLMQYLDYCCKYVAMAHNATPWDVLNAINENQNAANKMVEDFRKVLKRKELTLKEIVFLLLSVSFNKSDFNSEEMNFIRINPDSMGENFQIISSLAKSCLLVSNIEDKKYCPDICFSYHINPWFMKKILETVDIEMPGFEIPKVTNEPETNDDGDDDDEEEARPALSNGKIPGYLPFNDIKETKLFFNEEMVEQFDRIKCILDKKNLPDVFERLNDRNTMKNVCISFFGDSGTGKTESIYQIAKETQHDIYELKISSTESEWIGKSERLINDAFTQYGNLVAKCKNIEDIPIMLINEADSIFSKRTDGETSAAQSKNKLVAELLDNIEKTKGVIFITTNKWDSFDEAFNRRFLLKVGFTKPTTKIQRQIWEYKFPELSQEDVDKLTQKYDLTPAGISNIEIKADLDYIIKGDKPTFEKLNKIASSSNESNDRTHRIGFGG